MDSQPDMLDKADNMLVQCGTFASVIQIVTSVICILCFCGFGIMLFKKKDSRIKTNATVLHGQCNSYPVKSGNSTKLQTDCMLDIEYKVGEEIKQAKITSNDKMHTRGEIIEVTYDAANIADVKYNEISPKTVGKILMGIGSCFIVLMIIHIILTNTSDWYKRLLCFNLIGSAFSGRAPGMNFGNQGYDIGMNPGFQTNFG